MARSLLFDDEGKGSLKAQEIKNALEEAKIPVSEAEEALKSAIEDLVSDQKSEDSIEIKPLRPDVKELDYVPVDLINNPPEAGHQLKFHLDALQKILTRYETLFDPE